VRRPQIPRQRFSGLTSARVQLDITDIIGGLSSEVKPADEVKPAGEASESRATRVFFQVTVLERRLAPVTSRLQATSHVQQCWRCTTLQQQPGRDEAGQQQPGRDEPDQTRSDEVRWLG
jgi:hypothetical protein